MNQSSDEEWNFDFLDEISEDVEENKKIIQCIGCGKCVGGCPASKISDYNIRKIIEKVLKGDKSVLKDSDIWYCFLCERCKRVCPKEGINIPLLILNLRNESFKKGYGPRYNDLTKYVEMSERFLTNGSVLDEPLDGTLPEERIKEIDKICDFARIKYVFKASDKNNSKKKHIDS
ncbi:MAG: 4Fe-4S dicluster domain-containing protein [Candidatus Lokiarchaeota archaeon]|nr:4Fe-4S dicluster domain-containing protein [Candidatus Lokiarchaeota archaeon]MBD3200946.1 4Fe-4S dicluster domain-containing protein [Candidatus Lokiarchaeota archaeon]